METMNIQAYSYTVMTCIIGMGIVFAFLGFLCVLMDVIKRIFDKPAVQVKKTEPAGQDKTPSRSEGEKQDKAEDTAWIMAAVAAYLEEEDQPRSAMAWMPSAAEKQDPWVNVPRIQKRLAAV